MNKILFNKECENIIIHRKNEKKDINKKCERIE